MSSGTDPHPTILLLQARRPDDPILEHEFECFVARTRYPASAFRAVNMAGRGVRPDVLEGVDMVTVGGAGDFSVVDADFAWYDDMLDTMRAVVDRGVPMFASCFGFHALVAALGGRLTRDDERSEIGTYEIRLSGKGREDSFLGEFPDRFDAQLGHKDCVAELPEQLVRLAESDRCRHQAVRLPDRPIYATQFHPELTADDNIERYARYIQNYKGLEESHAEAMDRAERIHRQSPVAERMLDQFIGRFVEGEAD